MNAPAQADILMAHGKGVVGFTGQRQLFQDVNAALFGPQKAPLKEATTSRFDADVLAAMKATGKGWQTRVNDVVRTSLSLAGRV